MPDDLTTVTPEIERDRWGRPMVVPPGGGNPVPYTRCTTYVGAIEDTWNLSRWQQRMVALGLSERDDLRLSVLAHRDDKKTLDKLCEDAAEVAKAHAGATIGTALHSFTERMDRGMPTGPVPPEYKPDLEAYTEATKDLTAVHIEQFCVLDSLKIGGTPDRVVKYNGKRYIADLKTGDIQWGSLKIAAQLAVYAHSHLYDVKTHRRSEHNAERDRGIIIHLPAGTGTCRLYWVDLRAGWEAVRVCRDIREKRALKYRDLVVPFDSEPQGVLDLGDGSSVDTTTGEVSSTIPVTTSGPVPEQRSNPDPIKPDPPSLVEQIKACRTGDEVRALWTANATVWTTELTDTARDHIGSLPVEAR